MEAINVVETRNPYKIDGDQASPYKKDGESAEPDHEDFPYGDIPNQNQFEMKFCITQNGTKFGYSIFGRNDALPIRSMRPIMLTFQQAIDDLERRLEKSNFEGELVRYIVFHLRVNKKETRTWEYQRF